MKRFPISWDRTLTTLGFRRNVKRVKRDHYRRLSRIEPLEVRAMLSANPFVVDTRLDIVDSGDQFTSLREALTAAYDNGPAIDRIEFAESLVGETILLGDADGDGTVGTGEMATQLLINSNVEIVGPESGDLTISGGNQTRVFSLSTDAGLNVTLEGLTITEGKGDNGAGIYTKGNTLTLDTVVIRNNESVNNSSGLRYGGGVFNQGGDLKIRDSLIEGNSGKYGAGVYANGLNGYNVEITGSTFTDNTASSSGGGLFVVGGGPGVQGTVSISNSTFSSNAASPTTGQGGAIRISGNSGADAPHVSIVNSTITENSAGYLGAGIAKANGTLTLQNTIVAGNTGSSAWWARDYYGQLFDGERIDPASSNNLLGRVSAGAAWEENTTLGNIFIASGDPLLSSLEDNTGSTPTHALQPGSLAIDAGNNTLALLPDKDQRGIPRSDGAVDIGAYERIEPNVTQLPVQGKMVLLVSGTDGDDTLRVSSGFGGVIYVNGVPSGYQASDVDQIEINGGAGNDTIDIRSMSAYAFTQLDSNGIVLKGGAGNDTIYGSNFNDRIIGGGGDDYLVGGFGDDIYEINNSLDAVVTIQESDGEDTIDFSGWEGTNIGGFEFGQGINIDLSADENPLLYQGWSFNGIFVSIASTSLSQIENVIGTRFDDTITGNPLNNRLEGGGGNDTLAGGLGDDVYVLDNKRDTQITIQETGGIDTLDFSGWTGLPNGSNNKTNGVDLDLSAPAGSSQIIQAQAWAIPGGQSGSTGQVTLVNDGLIAVENLIGTNFDDILTGNSLDNRLVGGLGNDTYRFTGTTDLGRDTIVEENGSGVDTLDFSSLELGVGVTVDLNSRASSFLVADGGGNQLLLNLNEQSYDLENVIGTRNDDIISGNSSDNRLEGGGGTDTLSGRPGNDTYVIGNDHVSQVTIDESSGNDTLDFSGIVGTGVSIDLSVPNGGSQPLAASLVLVNNDLSRIENVIGTPLGDAVTGNSLDNRLEGNGGDDTLSGGLGDDTYTVDNKRDAQITIQEAGGIDTLDFSGWIAPPVETGFEGLGITLDLSAPAELFQAMPQQSWNLPGVSTGSTGQVIFASSGFSQIENVVGTQNSDTITGNSLDNRLEGGNGDDTYRFVGATDQGNDTIIDESSSGGIDTLDFSQLDFGIGVDVNLLASYGAAQQVINNGSEQLTLTLQRANRMENVVGTVYDDSITANSASNRLEGGLGDDTYKFGSSYGGTDTIVEFVGEGADTLDFSTMLSVSNSTGVNVDLGSTDSSYSVQGSFRLDMSSSPELENIVGSNRNDTLTGNSLDNYLAGGLGNDTYLFSGTDDYGRNTIFEQIGEGSDTIDFSALDYGVGVTFDLSEQGSDYEVVSDAGRSIILDLTVADLENATGTQYNDILIGDENGNRITGNAGDDNLVGNGGDDVFAYTGAGDLGKDQIVEDLEEGNDTFDFSELTFGAGTTTGVVFDLNNQSSDYEIVNAGGTRVALDLSLSPEIESVIGTTGNDILTGNSLDNRLEGGLGDDTYRFLGTTDQGYDTIINESSSGGSDTLDFSQLDFGVGVDVNLLASNGTAQQVINNGSEQLTLSLERANRIENVIGTVYDDSITANSRSNRLEGGLGNDTYKFGSSYGGTDTIVELAEEGTDTIDFSTMLSASNSTGVNIDLGSTDSGYSVKGGFRFDMSSSPELENIIGSNRNDTLTGNSLDNQLAGGLGDDTYLFSGTDDFGRNTIFEQIGEGSDTIDFSALEYGVGVAFDLRELGNNYEVVNDAGRSIILDLSAAELENATGTQYNDILIGDAGNNRLEAGEGWDTLAGGEGDDTYAYVTSAKGLDKIIELVGEGIDTLDFSDLQFENNQDDGVFIDLSSDAITYVTGPWWDSLELDFSATPELENVIGSSHADLLIGNALDNRLEGGQGDDTFGFWGNIDQGHDTIIDSSGIGTLNFSALDLGSGVAIDLSDSSATQITIGTGPAQLSLDISGAHYRIENLVGTPYNDTLIGNNGANFLDGGGGNDILEGKSGNDIYSFSGNIDLGTDTIIEATGGSDTLDFSNLDFGVGVNVDLGATGTAEVIANTGLLSLTLDLSNAGELENVIGTNYGDTIVSNSLDNRLEGQSGNDTYVYGGTTDHGRDTIIDQIGLSDTLDFSALDYGVGIDLSLVSQTWTTPVIDHNGQSLKIDLSEASIDRVIGTNYGDAITAGDWDSTLEGGLGDDTYRFSGVGARAIANGLSIDTAIVELAGEGDDTIDMTGLASGLGGVSIDLSSVVTDQLVATHDSSGAELRFDLSSAVELENVRGTNYADTISGNTLDNRLEGAGGSDTYVFKGSVGLGYDAIIDSSSQNTIDFSGADFGTGISFDLALAQGTADYTVLNDSTDRIRLDLSQANLANVIGTIYNDTLVGDASSNRLEGREGDDLIVGGVGSDTYVGGAGADVIELPTTANSNQIEEDTFYHLRRPESNLGAYSVLDLPADIAITGVASAAIGETIQIATIGHTVDDLSSLDISFSGVALSELSVSPDGSVLWTAGGLVPGRVLPLTIIVSDTREQLSTISMALVTTDSSQSSTAFSASGNDLNQQGNSVDISVAIGSGYKTPTSYINSWDGWTLNIGSESVSMAEPGYASSETLSFSVGSAYPLSLAFQGSSLVDFLGTPMPPMYSWSTSFYLDSDNNPPSSDVVVVLEDELQTGQYDVESPFGDYVYEYSYSATYGPPIGLPNQPVGPAHFMNNSGGISAKLHVQRIDIDVAGLSDEGEMSGDGILDLNEYGFATITVHPIPGLPAGYGGIKVSGGELFRNSDGTDLVEGVLSASETHTFYAKGPGTVITATYGYLSSDGAWVPQDSGGYDSVTLSQKAIVYGIGGTGSERWLSSPNNSTENGRWNSHVRNFVVDSYATHKKFSHGSGGAGSGIGGWTSWFDTGAWTGWMDSGTGADSREIRNTAVGQILAMREEVGEDAPIAIVGWSRGGMQAIWVADTLAKMGVDVDFIGAYDPVDMAISIPGDTETVGGDQSSFLAVVAPETHKNNDHSGFVRMGLHDRISGIDALLLLPASHGSIGGTPGYNDGEEDDADGYAYLVDKTSSEEADRFMREKAYSKGIPVPQVEDYGFPDDNPTAE